MINKDLIQTAEYKYIADEPSDNPSSYSKEYIKNSNERLKMYGFIEKESVKGDFKKILLVFEDRFGKIPNELSKLIIVMKIKRMGSLLGVDKIILKEVGLTFVFFNESNTKQKTFSGLIQLLNKNRWRYAVKEKKGHVLIKINKKFNLEKTLFLLKKIKK